MGHRANAIGLFRSSQAAKSYAHADGARITLRAMQADAARALIAARVEEMDIPLATLSKQIGKSHSYLQQFLRRGIPKVLPEDVREALGQALNVDPEALRGAAPAKGGPRAAQADAVATTVEEAEWLRAYRRLSPAARRRALKIIPTLD